jgi:predicted nucleic acid-binding protein
VAEEVSEHVPTLAERRGLDAALLLAAVSIMPVDWQPAEVYEPQREEAKRRMAGRDPEDWPTVALALARSLPIWSQDKDMEAAGVTVYTTGELLDAIRNAGESA